MWRGNSDGEDRPTDGRDERDRSNARPAPGQTSRVRSSDRRSASDDPRSEPTGRKIRRIESGHAPTSSSFGSERSRIRRATSGPSLASRGGGHDFGDPTDIGGPPSEPPARSIGRPPSDSTPGSGFGLGGGSLPPLNQPSGEVPAVPTDLAFSPPTDPDAGVFDAPPADAERSIDRSMPSSLASGGTTRSAEDQASGFDLTTSIDGERELSPALRAAKVAGELGTAPPAFPDRRSADPMAPTDPFPDWSETSMDPNGGDRTEAMAIPARDRLAAASAAAGAAAGRSGDRSALDAPINVGSGAGTAAAGQRLQDTELKLAGQRRKQKPKEPNRAVLFLAMALVVLAGVAVAWWLTRDDGTATEDEAGDTTADALAPAADGATDADGETPATEVAAEPEPLVDEPTLFFDEAQLGPLDRDTTYSIDLVGEPEGSLLQVVVDDIPQGQPDLALPDLILPAGRHTIQIAITNGAEVTNSTPVEVYVLGDPPPAGYIANLASVDIQNEGWAEAIRRFDEFRVAGHESVEMLPLTAGYWNIYVGGLGNDPSAVDSYCEGFQLSVPDQCFPKLFDPATYTPPAPAASADATTGATDSMTDQSGETPSTTTSGG